MKGNTVRRTHPYTSFFGGATSCSRQYRNHTDVRRSAATALSMRRIGSRVAQAIVAPAAIAHSSSERVILLRPPGER
ncbi:hypothetical protein [Actinobaculum suis]|uniref:Uncharacterized protein n=1 Tax=Actinobaculum suis TaxID=1657 RepID=A0AAW9HP10_9ACTO|nr:hypothetical protein [Actinobaculum suis]KMY23951.1 hypothetical protein ACU19_01130 [Actinobaculum suis]MDY5153403.1 hypothetical protein [Actinobaculum suis]OCA93375.1 hypothetical protein ACU20_00710 [Actinobaculum suis]OCA94296.1 hypothetical protein ACU21_00760 [Actinobaculum suis]